MPKTSVTPSMSSERTIASAPVDSGSVRAAADRAAAGRAAAGRAATARRSAAAWEVGAGADGPCAAGTDERDKRTLLDALDHASRPCP
ncbi:hypothetical protein GCM10026982_02730 [Nocardiopsis aegyptia]